jgi:hypothetical protein
MRVLAEVEALHDGGAVRELGGLWEKLPEHHPSIA